MADAHYDQIRLTVTKWAGAAVFYDKHGFRPTDNTVPTPEPPLQCGIQLPQVELELMRDHSARG
jgi:hypothetical protein